MRRQYIAMMLLWAVCAFAGINDWRTKTPAQLSGMQDYVTIPNTSYWNTHAYLQIYDLLQSTAGVADTTALIAVQENKGAIRYLQGYASTANTGAGLFILCDSTLVEGNVAFDSDSTGLQWIRYEYESLSEVYTEWFSGIDAAFDWLPDGCKVFTPANTADTLLNTTPIMIPSNTTLIMPKSYKIEFRHTSGAVDTQGVFRMRDVHNIYISGGELDGNATYTGITGSENMPAIAIRDCQNIHIENMYIHDFPGDGILMVAYADSCEDITINNCNIDIPCLRTSVLTGRNAISVISGQRLNISNNILRGGFPGGIDLEPNNAHESHTIEDFIISGNIVTAADSGYGISIACGNDYAGHTNIVRNGLIINNTVRNTYLAGIDIGDFTGAGTSTVANVTVASNYVYNCGEYTSANGAIYIRGAACVIRDNYVQSSLASGIMALNDGDDITIENNVISGSAFHGIYFSAADSICFNRVTIKGNTIRNNSAAASDTYCGLATQYVAYLDVQDNFIYNTVDTVGQKYGLWFSHCDSLNVAHNWIFSSVTTDTTQYNTCTVVTKGFNRIGALLDYGDLGTSLAASYLKVDGSTVLTSAGWQWKISTLPGDTLPAWTSALASGELHSNNTASVGSDRGFFRLSAGGGADSTRKSGIDIVAYSAYDSIANRIYLKPRWGIATGIAQDSSFVAPLGLIIGTVWDADSTKIDSAKVTGGKLKIYIDGKIYAISEEGA